MKKLKLNLNSLLLCIFELVVGVLLLVDPVGFTSGIIIACGAVLLVVGLWLVVRYFRMEPKAAAMSQVLLKGLIALLFGAFCAFRSAWFIRTFPLFTMVYGLAILVTGLSKLQWAIDLLRMKKAKWYLPAISAVVSVLLAAVILAQPFASTVVMWRFTGVSLIVGAVLDIVVLCFSRAIANGNP